jgi:hypothetical protein
MIFLGEGWVPSWESRSARRPVVSEFPSASLRVHFAELTDPRRREVTYPLINVIVIGICAVISGADDFVAMAEFGRVKRKFLEQFLDLSAGIPSHDRFNAIFAALKPEEFEKCLLSWITALHQVTAGQVIAIDGKTLRRSFDQANGKSAIHMVSDQPSVGARPPPTISASVRRWSIKRATRSQRFPNC